MSVNVKVEVSGGEIPSSGKGEQGFIQDLTGEAGPFPPIGVSGFLSHFIISLKLPGKKGLITLTLPSAVQTVSRSHPFIYQGEHAGRQVANLRLPQRCTLVDHIEEKDFTVRPKGFFQPGHEAIWLQILNIDARANTDIGPVRIILGETLKREYPDIFLPSLGAVESIGRTGFPARLFFSPVAVLETSVGAFRTSPKALVGTRITSLPPIGAPPILQEPVALHSVDELRASAKTGAPLATASAQILALAHPIDALLLQDPELSFQEVEFAAQAKQG